MFLLNTLFTTLQASTTHDEGVKFPNGDADYAYVLRRQAAIDITPEEVHELGLAEVERI